MALLLTYKMVWLLAGIFVAWKSRVISIARFQERQQLGYAIYNLAFSIFIFLPVSFLFSGEVVAVYVVRCVGLMLITTFTLAVVIVPKFYRIYWMRGNADLARHLGDDGNEVMRNDTMDGASLKRMASRNGESRNNHSVSRTQKRDSYSQRAPSRLGATSPVADRPASRGAGGPVPLYHTMTPDSIADNEGLSTANLLAQPSSAATSHTILDSQPGGGASRWSINTTNAPGDPRPSDVEMIDRLSAVPEPTGSEQSSLPPFRSGRGSAFRLQPRTDRAPSLEGPQLSIDPNRAPPPPDDDGLQGNPLFLSNIQIDKP